MPYYDYLDWITKQENKVTKQEQINNKKMKKPFIEYFGLVAIWTGGIVFGGLIALTIIISFVTWNFVFYIDLMNWFLEYAAFTRTMAVLTLFTISFISYIQFSEGKSNKSDRKNRHDW